MLWYVHGVRAGGRAELSLVADRGQVVVQALAVSGGRAAVVRDLGRPGRAVPGVPRPAEVSYCVRVGPVHRGVDVGGVKFGLSVIWECMRCLLCNWRQVDVVA